MMRQDFNSEELEARMNSRGVKPTAVRLLVFAELRRAPRPLSMGELEERLQTVDKSTIFRTLTLFLEHHLIHSIEDGSGAVKYEMCCGEWDCSVQDMHVHFFCEGCHRTFCFKELPIPKMELPEGFQTHGANFVIKGLCPLCASKRVEE